MPKNYQTEIMIYHAQHGPDDVRITRRRQTKTEGQERYYAKTYIPTPASWQRLNSTVAQWINKNWANVSFNGHCIFIEPTI